MTKILVTPRSITAAGGHTALQALREVGWKVILSAPGKLPTEEELLERLPGCVGYLAGVEKVPAKVLQLACTVLPRRTVMLLSRNMRLRA